MCENVLNIPYLLPKKASPEKCLPENCVSLSHLILETVNDHLEHVKIGARHTIVQNRVGRRRVRRAVGRREHRRHAIGRAQPGEQTEFID